MCVLKQFVRTRTMIFWHPYMSLHPFDTITWQFFLFNYMCYIHIYFSFFYLGFKSTYQQITYENRGNHLNAFTFHSIIIVFFWDERKYEHTRYLFFISVRRIQKYLSTTHLSKQKKPPGLYFFKMRATLTYEVPTFYICNMSSKIFLNNSHTKTEETT